MKKRVKKQKPQLQGLGEAPVILGPSGPTAAGWHAIESFLRCPKEYQLRQVRKVVQPQAQTPDYFAVGSMVHAGRAHWFAEKFDTSEKALARVNEAIEAERTNSKLPVSTKAEQDARKYVMEFIQHWSVRAKPKVIAAEYEIGPAPLEPNDPFFLWRTARLDDLSIYPEAGDKLCIGECKTTSGSINDAVNQYILHGQPILQVLLYKNAPQGEAKFGPVAGVMLDIIKKGYGAQASSFARVFVPVTDRTLSWYVKNMKAQLRAAANVDWNADVPRNITACTRLVGRARVACEYRELCMHGRSASIKYVLEGGSSLLTWKPNGDKVVPPWE